MPTTPTHQVTIWMAGDLATAHRVVREFCYAEGACFTVTASKFIYTAGEEDGFAIGLVNYPRFPSAPAELELAIKWVRDQCWMQLLEYLRWMERDSNILPRDETIYPRGMNAWVVPGTDAAKKRAEERHQEWLKEHVGNR